MSSTNHERPFAKEFSLAAIVYVLTGFPVVGRWPGSTPDKEVLMKEVAQLKSHLMFPDAQDFRQDVTKNLGEASAALLVDHADYMYLLTTFVVHDATVEPLNRFRSSQKGESLDAEALAEFYFQMHQVYGPKFSVDGYTE